MARRGDNIRRRADGRWEGRYRCQKDDNSYRYKSVYGKSYGEVKERLLQRLRENHMGISEYKIDKKKPTEELTTLNYMAEEWLQHVEQTKKYSTYIKYRNIYVKHIKDHLSKTCISDLSDQYINEKLFSLDMGAGISNSTRHSIIAVLNQALRYAHEYCDCPQIKLKNKVVKRNNKTIKIMDHTEQAKLISYLYSDLDASKAGILLCISTGLRLGEICSLKWEDIDFNQMLIHVNRTVQRIAVKNKNTKTELMITPPKSIYSIREIPISDSVREFLLAVRTEGQEYLLCDTVPMEPRTYENHFKKYLKAASVKTYNFHVIRHTFATNCIDSGMDVKSLSEILGHSDVRITMGCYVHPPIDTKRKYLNALADVYGQYCGQGL